MFGLPGVYILGTPLVLSCLYFSFPLLPSPKETSSGESNQQYTAGVNASQRRSTGVNKSTRDQGTPDLCDSYIQHVKQRVKASQQKSTRLRVNYIAGCQRDSMRSTQATGVVGSYTESKGRGRQQRGSTKVSRVVEHQK